MENERRKHLRKNTSLIIDYQNINDHGDKFDKRAFAINISTEGICLYTPYREKEAEILLLRFPCVEQENLSVIKAQVKYSIKAPVTGYYNGLYVFPAFHIILSRLQTITDDQDICDLELEEEEKEYIKKISGNNQFISPAILGICHFFRDLHIKMNKKISSDEELKDYLIEELKKRIKHD
jgi:hypothetical protein